MPLSLQQTNSSNILNEYINRMTHSKPFSLDNNNLLLYIIILDTDWIVPT